MDSNIYVKWSANNATNWTGPIQVNATSTRSQFFPGLAVDRTTGRVAVSWYDCRNDSGNKLTHFYAAVSTDGFSTAQPRNFQLTPTQSDGTQSDGCDGSVMNYGDYTGLAFHGGYLVPVWINYGTAINRCGNVNTCKVAW
jgi:hypothetical protein